MLLVPDNRHERRATKPDQELLLHGVGILDLIEQVGFPAALVVRDDLGMVEGAQCVNLEVSEVQDALPSFGFLQTDRDLLERPSEGRDEGG